jgi:hypothetical protein
LLYPLVGFLSGCSDHSPITNTAHSLRMLLHHWLLFYIPFLFPFWRRSTPTQGPIPDLSQPAGNPYHLLHDVQSDCLLIEFLWCPFNFKMQLPSCTWVIYSLVVS